MRESTRAQHDRGYGPQHRRLRASWKRRILYAGGWPCGRCGQIIKPGDRWDLGHNEERTGWTGPECQKCNRSAGAQNANRNRINNKVLEARPIREREW